MAKTTDFLSLDDEKALMESIRTAEKHTTGEIRVHIEMKCPGDPLVKAKEMFGKLGMHRTEQRNGILLYVAFNDRKAAIFGDEGIAAHVDQSFWDSELQTLFTHFRDGNYLIGMQLVVLDISSKLSRYFPTSGFHENQNPDELSNEISRGSEDSK